MRLFDTHAHYDDARFDPDRDALLASLPRQGVEYIVNPGTNAATSAFAVELASRYDFVYAAAGVHPHEASGITVGTFGQVFELLRAEKVVAVGEIGLDYHYDFSPRETQRDVFWTQLAVAKELKLPVIVHDREAHADCLEIIREFPGLIGVFHSFSGSWEYAKTLLSMGWYLSFTGSITFNNAYRVHETVAKMPLDRIMIETDAPYLTPVPHRGKRNESSLLSFVCNRAAELRGISPEEMALQTLENGRRFFGI